MTTLTVLDGPDLTDVGELLEVMKQTLSSLGATFDSLGEQTARVAAIGPAMESAHQINHLRRQLQVQDRKQEERITELKILLRDVLKEQIIEHLRGHVYAMIREQVAQQVRDQVEFQLREQIPQKLRDQVREHKRQIAEVRKSLHNSEARRANSLLRSNHLLEPLHPLVRSTGEVSEIFPKNLAAIFALGPASARQLCQEYGLPETDSRE
ncbi:hypothetical protein SISNIDRAFT_419953 [Sistotremastrum niveocremeum HHB9708]|uniref:Uncharacterized protein n=2 Tax=Sistotremastraceae TaxID=3402574 RepID=A0A164MZ36_9AGAM|nr:hypothetical protein SISNIDRAFT_419953 [Sistotremastrum niveocremeum HHB9708]KZT33450.1 hypothetical protein SISSUDRAFT_993027 [Sistotremastrum suecicum HHB10207 ss-3]